MVPSIPLRDHLKIKHGFAFSSEYFREVPTDNILLTPGNFHVDQRLYFGKKTKFYDGPIPNGYVLENGDLLVVMTDLTKDMAILGNAVVLSSNKRVLHNQRIGLVQIEDPECVDRDFLCNLLNSDIVQKHVRATASGTTVRHTSPGKILDIAAPIPPLPEQRKIAEILGTWDRAIEVAEAQLAAAKTQKRALMQHLLTGKRRFPEFEGQPWKEVRLGDVLDINYGKSPKEILVENGRLPVLGTGGITGRTNSQMALGPAIVIGRKGTIDRPQWIEGGFWCIDTTYYCTAKSDANLQWIFAWLSSINLRTYNEASGVPSLSRDTLRSIRLKLPTPNEQRRVADIFIVCDQDIQALSERVQSFRTEKKALIQQLLTGKRRVTT